MARILAFFFLVTPAVIAYAVVSSGQLHPPSTGDDWAILAILIFSPALGLFVWLSPDREWHFTGDEILAYQRGREIWRVPIDSITDAKIERAFTTVLRLQFTANGRRYSIPLVPALRRYFIPNA